MDPRSNPGRGFWIGRLGRFGAWGRRRVTAGDPARGGGALGSPDLAKPGRPGVKSTRFWVCSDLRGMGSLPGL